MMPIHQLGGLPLHLLLRPESFPPTAQIPRQPGQLRTRGAPATLAAKKVGVTPKGGAKPKLWDGDWPAKVVGLEGLPKLLDTQPAVVVVRTSAAQFEAELWARDREATAGTTVVLLVEGTDPVLLRTA